MKAVKATKLALIATATVAATLSVSAPAHAESNMYQFLTPSGNIGCHMDIHTDGWAYAWCRLEGETWAPSPGDNCAVGNVPGSIGEPASYVQLSQGRRACTGAVMSQLFFSGPYAPPTLAYGQTNTAGTITCASEPSGVRCTDASTGHFFQVSRDSYELG